MLGILSALNIAGTDKERIKTTIYRGDHKKRKRGRENGGIIVEFNDLNLQRNTLFIGLFQLRT